MTVGHLPKEQSRVCHFFIQRGGVINVEVINSKKRRSNLSQGGTEIPALLHCIGQEKDIAKLSSFHPDLEKVSLHAA